MIQTTLKGNNFARQNCVILLLWKEVCAIYNHLTSTVVPTLTWSKMKAIDDVRDLIEMCGSKLLV